MTDGDQGIHKAFALNFTLVADDLSDPTIWLDALGEVIRIAVIVFNLVDTIFLMHQRLLYKWAVHGKLPSITTNSNFSHIYD